jgi:putative zinc finger/helix-turn-helix YgiT family protein
MPVKDIHCPRDNKKMVLEKSVKKVDFRGKSIAVPIEQYECRECGAEAGNIDQASVIQKKISDAYRKSVGLLTGEEIFAKRTKLGLTQEGLAKRMHVGIVSIKRWEGGAIQTQSMDRALRIALTGESIGDTCTGNRDFSLARIKMVLTKMESLLGRKIFRKNDRMLYAAKYLWYADMVAHRETGQSITGATYAALPLGPQLNNYKDLIDEIMNADLNSAVPLSAEEEKIITRLALNFPKEKMVFEAAHKEEIWKEKPTGHMIPYTDSVKLTAL